MLTASTTGKRRRASSLGTRKEACLLLLGTELKSWGNSPASRVLLKSVRLNTFVFNSSLFLIYQESILTHRKMKLLMQVCFFYSRKKQINKNLEQKEVNYFVFFFAFTFMVSSSLDDSPTARPSKQASHPSIDCSFISLSFVFGQSFGKNNAFFPRCFLFFIRF